MTSKAEIDDFLAQRTLAVVGVSRRRLKFGTIAYHHLKARGYRVYPVNPNATVIDGQPCYPTLRDLPGPVGGVLSVVPPDRTLQVARDAASAGIRRLWIHRGTETDKAIEVCRAAGIRVVVGQCILMHAQPDGIHRLHRFLNSLLGRLPA
ncbi:MAG: CoA-binding protein [bacterium]|nr:CoA-binding protein [bacterium]